MNERDGKIRECEDDDVLWNEMSNLSAYGAPQSQQTARPVFGEI